MMVTGRSQCGMASTGFRAPESEASGGLTKKAVSCACCADLLNVAPEKSDSGSEEIKLVKVDLYTESMKFTYKK